MTFIAGYIRGFVSWPLYPVASGWMGSLAAPVDLDCSSEEEKNNKWLQALLKLLAICKWLGSNIWSISLLLFPENIRHIVTEHIFWEKLSLPQRGSEAKCPWKLPGHTRDETRFLLSSIFSFYFDALSVNKIFQPPFFFCIPFLAWSLVIPPTSAEDTWKWKQWHLMSSSDPFYPVSSHSLRYLVNPINSHKPVGCCWRATVQVSPLQIF